MAETLVDPHCAIELKVPSCPDLVFSNSLAESYETRGESVEDSDASGVIVSYRDISYTVRVRQGRSCIAKTTPKLVLSDVR